MSSIGAVIVTYNSEGEIGRCLDALQGKVPQAVVVDNASSDSTLEEVRKRPWAQFIANSANRGFAAAVNQGVQALSTDLVLLLNPDVFLQTGVEALAETCLRPGAGAAAGMLVSPEGRPQVGFSLRRFPGTFELAFEALGLNRFWPGNPVNRRYRCLDLDLERPCEAEQPAGAFLMFRKDVWAAMGGFDESFWPVWFEDVDFLKRVWSAGYRIYYCPQAVAAHLGGGSVARLPEEQRVLYWYASYLRFVQKHFRAFGKALIRACVVAGCLLRALSVLPVRGRGEALRAYGKVIWFACCGRIAAPEVQANRGDTVVRGQDDQQAGRDLIQAHGTK